MKNKKYRTVGTDPKSNTQIIERGKIDTTNTQIRDCSIFFAWYMHFNKKNGGYKLVLWAQIIYIYIYLKIKPNSVRIRF